MSSPKKAKLDTSGLTEVQYDQATFKVTPEMKAAYDWDGAIMVRKILSDEEVTKLTTSLENNNPVTERAWGLDDGTGSSCRLVIWNQPGNDITGMVARVEKVAKTCEALSGGEVYHYHSKLVMKEPRTGGKLLWHQDYGYWYKNGCLRPDLMTVFIALDRCNKANGCLQIVKGTHRCGRIEHVASHGQTQADQERVDEILKQFELMHIEMEAGDAIFFHCNVLHTSDKNLSDTRRWAFLVAYNRADNDSVYIHHHGPYTPLKIVPNTAIMDCDTVTDISEKDFMDPTIDKTVKATLLESGFH